MIKRLFSAPLGLILSLTLGMMVGCSGSMPTIEIELSDSLVYVLQKGPGARLDSNYTTSDGWLRLSPDTSRYHEVIIYADTDSPSLFYYRLEGEAWLLTTPQPESETQPSDMHHTFGGTTADGHYAYINELYKPSKKLVVILSDAHLGTITRAERDSLYKSLGGADSVHFIYLMLTQSDSTARLRLERDSLEGTIFSDSLSIVTNLRKHLGINRSKERHIFVMDSTTLMSPINL